MPRPLRPTRPIDKKGDKKNDRVRNGARGERPGRGRDTQKQQGDNENTPVEQEVKVENV
jgi:hypothetical protein